MINPELKKTLIVIIIILTSIFFIIYQNNILIIEIITLVSVILLLLLTKKQNHFEDYAPYFIILILAVFLVYQGIISPQPQISVEIERLIISPPQGEITTPKINFLIKFYDFEGLVFGNFSDIPSNFFSTFNESFYSTDFSTRNEYAITIRNKGNFPISLVNVYLSTPFSIQEKDIIYADNIVEYEIDKGEYNSGKMNIKIKFLDIGNSVTIKFTNRHIGEIAVGKCLENDKVIDCNINNRDGFLIKIPQNRKIKTINEEVYEIKELNERGFYYFYPDGKMKYIQLGIIEQGRAITECKVP